MEKLVLITGCGRSGTKYISQLLSLYNLDVPHEKMGEHGTANWCMAVDAEQVPWGEPPGKYHFGITLHQCRHPFSVIRSVQTFRESSWKFIADHIHLDLRDPILLNSARYWLYWNRLCEKKTDAFYAIENYEQTRAAMEKLGVKLDPSIDTQVSSQTNSRGRSVLYDIYNRARIGLRLEHSSRIASFLLRNTLNEPKFSHDEEERENWSLIRKSDKSLAISIAEQAVRYGYEELPL